MAKIPQRWDAPGQWYFVTVVTKYREPVFEDRKRCQDLMLTFREVRQFHRYRLAGLTILPDHWHTVICPVLPVVVEKVVSAVKQNLLQKIWLEQKRPTIWQPQFLDHRIRDESDFLFHLEYMRTNAVKHGYVKEVGDFEWCFIHESPFGRK